MPNELTKGFMVAMFTQGLGQPVKTLKKIVGWRVRPDLDLVIQLDSRQAADQV